MTESEITTEVQKALGYLLSEATVASLTDADFEVGRNLFAAKRILHGVEISVTASGLF